MTIVVVEDTKPFSQHQHYETGLITHRLAIFPVDMAKDIPETYRWCFRAYFQHENMKLMLIGCYCCSNLFNDA